MLAKYKIDGFASKKIEELNGYDDKLKEFIRKKTNELRIKLTVAITIRLFFIILMLVSIALILENYGIGWFIAIWISITIYLLYRIETLKFKHKYIGEIAQQKNKYEIKKIIKKQFKKSIIKWISIYLFSLVALAVLVRVVSNNQDIVVGGIAILLFLLPAPILSITESIIKHNIKLKKIKKYPDRNNIFEKFSYNKLGKAFYFEKFDITDTIKKVHFGTVFLTENYKNIIIFDKGGILMKNIDISDITSFKTIIIDSGNKLTISQKDIYNLEQAQKITNIAIADSTINDLKTSLLRGPAVAIGTLSGVVSDARKWDQIKKTKKLERELNNKIEMEEKRKKDENIIKKFCFSDGDFFFMDHLNEVEILAFEKEIEKWLTPKFSSKS